MKKRKSIKKYIIILAVLVFGFFIACAGITYYVDPFFHYHAPLDGFPYVVDNQVDQNPGLARHMDYDSVILGSSMTVNFETDWFAELMDLKTLKLSSSGAYPRDIADILEKIYEPQDNGEVRNIKKVFLGIDVFTYSGDINERKYPLPEYLYDDNPFNDIKYLINKEVLLNYIIKPKMNPEPVNWSHIYASWWTDEYYNEDYVIQNHNVIAEQNPVEMDAHAFDDLIAKNLEANIIPFIENHPETEFVIFFPPYSIIFWNDAIMDNHLEATINSYLITEQMLKSYDNVTMYYFADNKDIVCDLNNYADYIHYHPSINRYMAECFVSGENIITKEPSDKDMESYIQKVREMLDGYDFGTLRKKLEGDK